MDQSPPKRVTRSRAAKVNEPSANASATTTTSRVARKAPSATRAKGTRATSATVASSTRTSLKRKLRSDDQESDEEDELSQEPERPSSTRTAIKLSTSTHRPRGRPKKIVANKKPDPEPEIGAEVVEPMLTRATSSTAATRGRKMGATVDPPTKQEPVRATRTTRVRKAAKLSHDVEPEESTPAPTIPSALKKTTTAASGTTTTATRATRTRGTMAATKTSVAKAPVKKTVKFEEPGEENDDAGLPPPPAAKSRTRAVVEASTTTTGLRAKPVRKAAAATRSTRAAASRKAGSAKGKSIKKTPLSPKKVTQMPVKQTKQSSSATTAAEQDPASEDELAMPDKTPLKKAPIKPPVSSVRKDNKENETGAARPTSQNDPEDPFATNKGPTSPTKSSNGFSLMGSPVRRAPQAAASPFKDTVKSPAKRIDLGFSQSVADVEAAAAASSLKTSLLQSPAKRPLIPIKQVDSEETATLYSPFKTSLLKSPAKRGSPTKSYMRHESADPAATPTPKTMALGTPLPAVFISANRVALDEEVISEEAIAEVLGESPLGAKFSGRLSAILPRYADPTMNGDLEAARETGEINEEGDISELEEDPEPEPLAVETEAHARPEGEETVERSVEIAEEIEAACEGDRMMIDELDQPEPQVPEEAGEENTLFAASPKNQIGSAFRLREKDLDPYNGMDSDSDDELANSPNFASALQEQDDIIPAAPKTPTDRLNLKPSQRLGFTPLAKQLGSWRSSSPKAKSAISASISENEDGPEKTVPESETGPGTEASDDDPDATESEGELDAEGDVDDEMEILSSAQKIGQEQAKSNFDPFADVRITDEDVALASEANEMSLLEPEDTDQAMDDFDQHNHDDTISEASQEYGDENAIPIDPALLEGSHHSNGTPARIPPVTPQRNISRTFHTVSKIPLKPADDSTPPLALKQRRASAVSRLPGGSQQQNQQSSPQRPRATRNATVISYFPSKSGESGGASTRKTPNKKNLSIDVNGSTPSSAAPRTPEGKMASGIDGSWSTAVTPARTPRADMNPALLKGAMVFVDVHTSEGANASGIFVELLSQMGAKCVKNWNWSPTSETFQSGKEKNAAMEVAAKEKEQKIGITHVVYKDGGKRTLEKVRESGGVVACVGVSWVLDCERENKWLDESPYLIDTSLLPRGGARRRKSMEPRALANLNGTLVSSKSSGLPSIREPHSAPATPTNGNGNSNTSGDGNKRRESAVWMRTPEKPSAQGDFEDEDGEDEWNVSSFLTPVPKTPAPEKIAEFAANVTPGSADDWTSSGPGGMDLDFGAAYGMAGQHTVAGLDINMNGTGSINMGVGSMMGMGGVETPSSNIMMGHGGMSVADPESPLAKAPMTCPPQNRFAELGQGVLGREKDERVLMRLMVAKRKSLQFAPKVGSPLAKAWN
ncbi:putative signal transducer protein [Zalerion maritima]|uniref:Signal transducer protein n=1 Tax=Zalerion maritima TaxID=339359 RepID=A0AAD5RRC7_9PEZI|nr:putative signal transducer protein [Zalerion maritima]